METITASIENGGDIGEQVNSLLGDVSDNQWTNNLYFDTYAAGFSNINGATFFDVQSPGPPYSIITHANDGTTLFDVVSNILNHLTLLIVTTKRLACY